MFYRFAKHGRVSSVAVGLIKDEIGLIKDEIVWRLEIWECRMGEKSLATISDNDPKSKIKSKHSSTSLD